jgi:mRNA-degrading endonuclease RelE of RelBE toxin-antitoxin system
MKSIVYSVVIDKKILKRLPKLPEIVQKKLNLLIKDLRDIGPILPQWPNYSKLGGNKYHCHLGYSWVACWKKTDETLIIEVYYVGSRENAPY